MYADKKRASFLLMFPLDRTEMFNEVGVIVFNMYCNVFFADVRIGIACQIFTAIFDFATVPLLITAEDCGVRRDDCPRMSYTEAIAHLYCDPLCFPINNVVYSAHCKEPFKSSNSKTYKRLNGTWKERLQCCKNPLYGRFASEIFQFGLSNRTSNLKLEFVEGTLMQKRAFGRVTLSLDWAFKTPVVILK
ncbi:hypothetical protein M3Y98_00439900 [Aphelenchoides besseyi]|nr:hypothetical protein M3Y98_00439900 [Aphelenchoides besseyi]